MCFAEKVRALLAARRMSQVDLATAIDVHQQTVHRWLAPGEDGRSWPNPPKAEHLVRIARALGTSVDYLIDDSLDSERDPDPGNPAPTPDEYLVLETYRAFRALGLDVHEAMRRLARPSPDSPSRELPGERSG